MKTRPKKRPFHGDWAQMCELLLAGVIKRTEQFSVWRCPARCRDVLEMKVLALAVFLCSPALGDLEQKGESRVHLSEGVGNRLVTHRVRPTCPDEACSLCEEAEVILKLVIAKSGTVKQITVVRAGDSRLAGAALDAVRQWRYGRYKLNGGAVEFETYTTIKSWLCGT